MSNFVEIEIGGKVRAFRFGLGTVGRIQKHLNVDIAGLGEQSIKNPFMTVPVILFFGHEHETRKRGQVVDFSIENFEDWLEDFEGTFAHPDIDGVLKVFFDSLMNMIPGAKEKQVELKKAEKKSSMKKTG